MGRTSAALDSTRARLHPPQLACPSILSFCPCLQVAPEPRTTGEGWGSYSASFRPHEVAVRRMVGDFSADWWARAQVSRGRDIPPIQLLSCEYMWQER